MIMPEANINSVPPSVSLPPAQKRRPRAKRRHTMLRDFLTWNIMRLFVNFAQITCHTCSTVVSPSLLSKVPRATQLSRQYGEREMPSCRTVGSSGPSFFWELRTLIYNNLPLLLQPDKHMPFLALEMPRSCAECSADETRVRCLPSSKAAHDTRPTQEPAEADETDNGQESSGVQKDLEEPGSSGGRGLLFEYVSCGSR